MNMDVLILIGAVVFAVLVISSQHTIIRLLQEIATQQDKMIGLLEKKKPGNGSGPQ